MKPYPFNIAIATERDLQYAPEICLALEAASWVKGTGIARRSEAYIKSKILEGKAVIACTREGNFAGFCYIESWGHKKYVANSGLIVLEAYRGMGLAGRIKKMALELSMKKFPGAKIFGLTTSLAVMRINSALGYVPVTFSELTDDETFWDGCRTCAYYDILQRTRKTQCLCTGMIYDPGRQYNGNAKKSKKKVNGKKAFQILKPQKTRSS